jgi:phosphohistidine phosphatase
MKLLVIRHAIAMDRTEFQADVLASVREMNLTVRSGKNDDFRPLTPDGIKKMKKNAKGLKAVVRKPDFLISSPLTRAVQTAEILTQTWQGLEATVSEALRPHETGASFVRWMKSLHTRQDSLIAIVGHEPQLTHLIAWLTTSNSRRAYLDFKKGGACLIDFAEDFDRGRGRLLWAMTPAILRELV